MLNNTRRKVNPKGQGQVGVRLDADTREMLTYLCQRWQCSPSEAVRRCISGAHRFEEIAARGGEKVLPKKRR